MSDYSDDVREGLVCQICGEYMGNECGYPRTCKDCKRNQ